MVGKCSWLVCEVMGSNSGVLSTFHIFFLSCVRLLELQRINFWGLERKMLCRIPLACSFGGALPMQESSTRILGDISWALFFIPYWTETKTRALDPFLLCFAYAHFILTFILHVSAITVLVIPCFLSLYALKMTTIKTRRSFWLKYWWLHRIEIE